MPTFPISPVPVWSVPVYARYRYEHRTECIELVGTGMYIVPNVPKFSVPVPPVPIIVLVPPVPTSYRTYGKSRYRYEHRTEGTEVLGTGTNIIPNVPIFSVPLYRRYTTASTPRYVPYRTQPWRFGSAWNIVV